jgi:hypothetical protein
MKVILGATMVVTAALSGCAVEDADPEALGSTSLEVRRRPTCAVIYFVSPGTQTIADGFIHVRDRTVRMHTSDPTGEFNGEMELLHNFDIELATGLGVACGQIVLIDVAAGTFAGDYAQDLFPGGIVEGQFQADATDEPRARTSGAAAPTATPARS